MKIFMLFLFLFSSAWAHERSPKTIADNLAYGFYVEQHHHQWPFPLLSIGHNMQSYQDYSNSPYWHDGLDIRSDKGQAIYAAAGGRVVNIENYVKGSPLYWEVAILDEEGFSWKYHHVDSNTITEEIRRAYENKTLIKAGTLIGNVVKWPVTTYGEVYHHLHLLVVGADGRYINPFLMMEPLNDTQGPIIHKIGLAQEHRPIGGNTVSGDHALYVEASDLTLHEKFKLPPYKISYRLDHGPEKLVWEFIHLPSGTNDTDFIQDFYLDETCGNYSCRKFYLNLNFSPEAPRGVFKLSPGTHEIEVHVEDIVGNEAIENFKWTVEVDS